MFEKLSDCNDNSLVQDVITKGLDRGLGSHGPFGESGRGIVVIRWDPVREFVQASDRRLLGYPATMTPGFRSR